MYMRFLCGCVMAGVLLFLAGTGPVFSQKKDDKDDTPATQGTPADYAALLQSREVVGKLSNVGGTKSLTFEIEYYVQAGGGNNNPLQALASQAQKQQQYQLQMAKLMQQQQQAMQQQSKNPQQQKQKMAQIAMQMQKLQMQQAVGGGQKAGGQPNLKAAYKEFEADLDPKVVVRRNFLIYDYDDKGYAKQYTQAEIAALRGKDSSKPGYIAKFDDLQPGAIVKLYLTNPGTPAEPKKKDAPKKDAKADPKKSADDEGVGNVSRPMVTMVLILADPPMNPNMPTKEMPKKKN